MPDPMRPLVDRLAAAGGRRTAAGGWPAGDDFDRTLAVLRAEHGGGDPEPPGDAPLARVADVFGLDDTDAALLWCAAATDLDASVGLACGQLRGLPGTARPTVALALELHGVPTATPEPFTRLGAGSPLRRHGLLELGDADQWLARPLHVPEPVLRVLAGGAPADPAVERVRTQLVPVVSDDARSVARAVEHGVPLVWIRSAPGMAGPSTAAGAFDLLGLPSLALDLRRAPAGSDVTGLVASGCREAGLRGWGLVVVGSELLADPAHHAAFAELERSAVPVVAVGARTWNPLWSEHFPLVLESAPLPAADRLHTWRTELGDLVDREEGLEEVLAGLRLPAEGIAEAARYAGLLAAAEGSRVDATLVRQAARRVGGAGGDADRVSRVPGTGPTFADLVLPDHVAGTLHQLVSWARHRDTVGAEGALRGRGRGIAALFTGNPGTGKTLSAHVIAEELSMELFQVDLSSIVDKYIGETEKNLERVFEAAEALDVVLFFDEADALFGSRSEVSDAKDRYANQEVSYLLQRMEHFDGITVLSTNLQANLDRAFARRMSFIIHFPDPDRPTRERLWSHHLDQLTALDPDDPVDVGFLAGAAEIAGGDIRNIVLGAAYDAAGLGTAVGNGLVAEAAVREYRKLGRVVPEHRFRAGTGPRTPRSR